MFGPPLRIRWWIVTFTLSSGLTVGAIFLGEFAYSKSSSVFRSGDFFGPEGDPSWPSGGWRILLLEHNLWAVIPVNYVLDAATLLATVSLACRFTIVSSFITRSWILLLDLGIAFVLANLCFEIGAWLEFGRFEHPYQFVRTAFRREGSDYLQYGNFGLASTTLLPTLAYVAILLVLLLSMAVFHGIRALLLQILELTVETDKSVFFYTGALLGACVLVGKLALELRTLFV